MRRQNDPSSPRRIGGSPAENGINARASVPPCYRRTHIQSNCGATNVAGRFVGSSSWAETAGIRSEAAPARVHPASFIPVLRPALPLAEQLLPYLRIIDDTRVYSNHGTLNAALERRLAEHLGLPAGGLVCASSGTAALVGAILASAGRGTAERPLAVMPAFTFVATALAAEQCGYRVCLADIDPDSWMLEPERLLADPRLAKAGLVIPVAPFGRPVPQAAWARFQSATGIPVVIDGAASFAGLTAEPDRFLGQIPVTISLHATKAFATGEGGAVATGSDLLARRTEQALNFGVETGRDCAMPGTNGKMSEYHAAVGLAELDGWPSKLEAWQRVAECYRRHLRQAGIDGGFYGAPEVGPNYPLFLCRSAQEAEGMTEALGRSRIDYRRWYGFGLHRHTYYRGIEHDGLSVSEDVAHRLIGLPVAPDLAESDVARIVDALLAGSTGGEAERGCRAAPRDAGNA
jgi:dTDP-4-amino-4,6-dideoxygalactose transaminase